MRFLVDIPLEDLLRVKGEHKQLSDIELTTIIRDVLETELYGVVVTLLELACPKCGCADLDKGHPNYKEYNIEDVIIEFQCKGCGTRFSRECKIDFGVKNRVT